MEKRVKTKTRNRQEEDSFTTQQESDRHLRKENDGYLRKEMTII